MPSERTVHSTQTKSFYLSKIIIEAHDQGAAVAK